MANQRSSESFTFAEYAKDGGELPNTLDTAATFNTAGTAISSEQNNNLRYLLGDRKAVTALFAGDSLTAIAEVILGITSIVDLGNGTALVTKTNHSTIVGEPVRISAAPVQALNVMDSQVLSIVDVNNIIIALGGRTHTITSPSAASIIFPNRRGTRGWLNWLETFLGQAFNPTWCAVAGAQAAQITALVKNTSILTVRDVGFVYAGMNNVYSLLQGYDAAWVDIKELIDTVRPKCKTQVIFLIPPRNSIDSQWTLARQAIHTKLNKQIYLYGLSIGAIVIDTWRATQNGLTYVNAAAANPDPANVMMFDNTHPSVVGSMAKARLAATALSGLMGSSGWKPAHIEAIGVNSGNLLSDSAFATNVAGVAAGYLVDKSDAGMNVTSTCVARTIANDGDAAGFNQVLTINYGLAVAVCNTRFRKNGIHGLLTVGNTYRLKVPFSVTGAVGLRGIELALSGTTAGGFVQIFGHNLDTSAKDIVGDFSGFLMTPEFVYQAGVTNIDMWVRPYISSAQSIGNDLVLTLWQPELLQKVE